MTPNERSQHPVLARPSLVLGAMVAVLVVVGATDFVDPNRAAVVALIVSPAAAAVLLPPRRTIVVSGVALALLAAAPDALVEDGEVHLVRAGALLGTAMLAAAASWWRERLAATAIDLAERNATEQQQRQEALELNDAVAQRLLVAYLTLASDDSDNAIVLVREALDATQSMVQRLLSESPAVPGAFVRSSGPVMDTRR